MAEYIGGHDYRDMFLEMVDDGLISVENALIMLVKWNSQDDMYEMMEANEVLGEDDE